MKVQRCITLLQVDNNFQRDLSNCFVLVMVKFFLKFRFPVAQFFHLECHAGIYITVQPSSKFQCEPTESEDRHEAVKKSLF